MLRIFDLILSAAGLVALSPVLVVLYAAGLLDSGVPLFRQERVGRHRRSFMLLKFRTMKLDTASVPTHLASSAAVTRYGAFLRATKLDELPQLWNVLRGDMSLVGPRPCLFSQTELIEAREKLGVYERRPGITGLAQVRGIDMSTPALLAATDAEMVAELNVANYFKLIFLTLGGRGRGDRLRS